jgi:hypothetical protein
MKPPMPETAAGRAYLLCFDPQRARLAGQWQRGYLLRTAALADLIGRGHLADVDGKPHLTGRTPGPRDAALRAVWEDLSDRPPGSWGAAITRRPGPLDTALRDQLAADGYIRITRPPSRFRRARIELRDPRVRGRLSAALRTALRGPEPVDRIDPRDRTVLVVLALGEIRHAIPRTAARENNRRITTAVEASAPLGGALKHVLRNARAQMAGG